MKILVAADMEGISGVTCWEQVMPDHFEYARFRAIMTAEVNAAVQGVYEAGAEQTVVTDGHNTGTNILVEQLDARARLNSGNGSPLSMVEGCDQGVNGVIFIGYHARAGSAQAILAHTWSDRRVANLWLNDILVGEYGLNGAVCGHYGAPVLMISGDQTTCAQASELLGPLETVVVKHATGFNSAECLAPQISQEQIQKASARAVKRLMEGKATKPFMFEPPVRVAIGFHQPQMAEQAACMPGARRVNGTRLEFIAEDMRVAYDMFHAAIKLALIT